MNTDDENISSLYHGADKPAPSTALDDAILAASRDAVEKPTKTKGPFSGGWPAATSIAAVIVITILLVPILKQQQSQTTLPQKDTETSGPSELLEENLPGAYRATEVKKKAAESAPPASAPVMLLQDGTLTEDRPVPASDAAGSGISRQLDEDETHFLEKEEALIPADTSGSSGSRMQASDSAPFAIYTPEMWEAKISQLIAEGRLEQARDEAGQLKQRYPDYTIDPSLLEQLR